MDEVGLILGNWFIAWQTTQKNKLCNWNIPWLATYYIMMRLVISTVMAYAHMHINIYLFIIRVDFGALLIFHS